MANEKKNRKRVKKPRQEWNPHWIIKLLYTVFSVALSAFKIAVGAAVTVALILIVCGIVFVGALGVYLQEDILTEAADWSIDGYDMDETSFIYYVDSGGNIQLLQQIYTTTDRQPASLDEIPQAMIDATVAIEDKRFYEHQGVDWITTIKACANMFFGGDSQFGGSTITQQLVKNVTEEKSITVQRKVMEIFRAQMFEREYDKDLIMERYLNQIYLGKGCFGVKSAAAAYFGKELQDLTVAECASLISITNNPSMFNPYSTSVYMYKGEERDGAGRNRYRQLSVLNEMKEQGYLTQEEYEQAVSQEMVFKDGISAEDRWAVCDTCGYGGTVKTYTHEGDSYFCPECGSQTSVTLNASQHVYSWFVDAVIIDVASDLAAQDGLKWDEMGEELRNTYLEQIQKGGYHIYTTLDMDVQNQVDKIYTDLNEIPTTRSTQQLQSAIVVIDNSTGDVVALSGGVGEKTDFFAYNKATQAKLQTGSSMKPISVYAPAFETGDISPATVIMDLPYSYNGGAFPRNDNRVYNYSRTILSGIIRSVNTIAVGTLDEIGTQYSYDFAKNKFGLSYLTDSYQASNGKIMSDVAQSPLALGALTVGATVRQMAAAYATFTNDGVYREARTYTKVYNNQGNIVLDNTQESEKILSDRTVNYINYCLYQAVQSGTGTPAQIKGQNVAGKTGTTSSNKDRWFCGYTDYYTAAVWCGYNQPEKIVLTGVTSNPAARLWKKVMEPIHTGLARQPLYDGSSFRTVTVCLDSGKLATDACRADARGIARTDTAPCTAVDAPTATCDKHVMVEYCVTGGGVTTEYCALFPDVEIKACSLVRMTEAEVEEIRSAMSVGLSAEFYDDSYVFLVDSSGDPLPWHGFRGNANPNSNAPYLECPLHTKEAWDAFQSTVDPLPPEETDPGIWGGEDQPGGNGDNAGGNGDNAGGNGGNEGGNGGSGLW